MIFLTSTRPILTFVLVMSNKLVVAV